MDTEQNATDEQHILDEWQLALFQFNLSANTAMNALKLTNFIKITMAKIINFFCQPFPQDD